MTKLAVLDRQTVLAEVLAHPHRVRLGKLCFDVLSRQAEGKVVFVARDWLDARVREHGLSREEAECALGNVIVVLERGPETARERQLISALAAVGFCVLFAESASVALAERFARHRLWLEQHGGFAPLEHVDDVADPAAARALWTAVSAISRDGDGDDGIAARSRRFAAVLVLARSASPVALGEVDGIATDANDPGLRALADALRPASQASRGRSLDGRRVRVPRGAVVEALRVVTGVALLAFLRRSIAKLLFVSETVGLDLLGPHVRVRRAFRAFGKSFRERADLIDLAELTLVRRERRWPVARSVVGATFFLVGIVLGGLVATEGWLVRAPLPMFVGIGVAWSLVCFDFLLETVLPASNGRVIVSLVAGSTRLALEVADASTADAWVAELATKRARLR
jgi:hypothetical protein